MSPEQEEEFAQLVVKMREFNKDRNGNRDPGIYVLPDDKDIKLDGNKVISVPAGHLVQIKRNAVDRKGFLTKPEKFSLADRKMYIVPADVGNSELKRAIFVGYTLEGAYLKGDAYAKTQKLKQLERTPSGRTGWTSLTRIFSDDGGLGYILFEESDYKAAGGTVTIPQSSINTTVAGHPGTLMRVRDENGQTMSSLDWTTKSGLGYSLKINQVDDASVASLTRIAESLARNIS